MTTHTEIIQAINEGKLDTHISEIAAALDTRRSNLDLSSFHVGDTVIFNTNCGTRYLVGSTAKVVDTKKTKVVVELHTPQGRFVKYVNGVPVSPRITVPVGIIDLAA